MLMSRRSGIGAETWITWVVAAQLIGSALAEYRPIDLTEHATSHHRDVFDRSNAINRFGGGRGFTEWFPPGEVTLLEVPFEIPQLALDCVSGSRDLKDSYWMPATTGQTVYFMGSGDLVGKKIENDLRLFNIEFIYNDGSSEEILPVNVGAKVPGWYDGTVELGAVASFNTLETFVGNNSAPSQVWVYAVVPSRPTEVQALLFNDNDTSGDYCITAMTESDERIDWIANLQQSRMHPVQTPTPTEAVSIEEFQDKRLVDIGPLCNQSATACFETGYRHGRGETFPLESYARLAQLPGNPVWVEGIPFLLSNDPTRKVISGSVKSLESFEIPLNATAGIVYLLMTRFEDASLDFGSDTNWDNHPYYFSCDLVYDDGERDRFFPRTLKEKIYRFLSTADDPNLRVYTLEPIQNKKVAKLILNDCYDQSDIALAAVTLGSEVSDVSIPAQEAPRYRPLREPSAPSVTRTEAALVVENAYGRIRLNIRSYPSLIQLYNRIALTDCFSNQENPNLLSLIRVSAQAKPKKAVENIPDATTIGQKAIEAKGLIFEEKRYELSDFEILKIETLKSGEVAGATMTLSPKDGADFEVLLALRMGRSPALTMAVSVRNLSNQTAEFKVLTYLTDLVIGSAEETHYFYPPPRGTVDKKPFKIRKCYGGATYMQLMDVFNPTLGAGISIRPDDAWGETKALSLWKSGSDPLVDDGWASYDPNMYLPAPERHLTSGVYMGFEYWERRAEPGQSVSVPDLAIGFHTGDWHPAFESYRTWVHSHLQPVEKPEWLQECALMSLNHCGMHLGDEYYAVGDRGIDFLQFGMWWNHPNRPDTGPREEYYYREDWGGKESFARAVNEAHEKGMHVILYLEGNLFPAHFEAGANCERLHPLATRVNRDGTLQTGNMCPGSALWQDYLSDTCKRLIRDTGADGIYLDSISQIPPFACYDPKHGHEILNQTWNRDVAQLFEKVRIAIREVNPQAVLYAEAPGAEIATAQLDGAYSYYPDEVWVTPDRFGNPKLTGLTRFLFPGLRNWSLVGSLIDPPKNLQGFFNADCVFTQSHIGAAKSALSPSRRVPPPSTERLAEVLARYADIFNAPGSLPHLKGLLEGIYVNRFQSGDKVIFNVLNTNYITARGRLIEVEQQGVYWDALSDRTAQTIEEDGKFYLSGCVEPKSVACFVLGRPEVGIQLR